MGFALFRSNIDQRDAHVWLPTDWVQPGPVTQGEHQHESGMKTAFHIGQKEASA
jgi:hypothetical protein